MLRYEIELKQLVKEMDWTKFQNYSESNTKAFETLCNQLFENWCKEEYKETITAFQIVNGAGGDGGVESFAMLNDDHIIGMQAKWFRESLNANRIGQIKNSIKTALKIRPQIRRYVVCIPRDLASVTGKGDDTEDKRWGKLLNELKTDYPDLAIELWTESRIDKELQKDTSAGILKFWFKNSEISEERIKFSFEKSKKGWLSNRYVPILNQFGTIKKHIVHILGHEETLVNLYNKLNNALKLIENYNYAVSELAGICGDKDQVLFSELYKLQNVFNSSKIEILKIIEWVKFESIIKLNINEKSFLIISDIVQDLLNDSPIKYDYRYHCQEIIDIIKKIEDLDLYDLIYDFKQSLKEESIVFLGEPGTGKTNGVAAITQQLIKEERHIPILIQAKNIPTNYGWKDIIISSLGIADNWDELELWQALSSLTNRKKIKYFSEENIINILPKVIIIVDGIDEASDYDFWKDKIKESAVILKNFPVLRFCFTSRLHALSGYINDTSTVMIPSVGDVPCYKLFDSYIEAYNIKIQNANWLKYSFSTPLTLKLFCEIYQNQTIFDNKKIDSSIACLLKNKIALVDEEFSKFSNVSKDNRYVFKTIKLLALEFAQRAELEREEIINLAISKLKCERHIMESLIQYLEKYGIIYKISHRQEGLLSEDKICYYIGIQGYFDYAIAIMLLDKYRQPRDIDFNSKKNIPHNSLYVLAIISIQQYDYLITENDTLSNNIDPQFEEELYFYSLRNSRAETADCYVQSLKDLMAENIEALIAITNYLVLPLSRNVNHPLGVSLLHNFLIDFKYPAHRDLLWSVPIIKEGYNNRYYDSGDKVACDEDTYQLTESDIADGLPTIYAWLLSNVNNERREFARTELMRWALLSPNEFFRLLLKFVNVNDQQVKSDLFSILMCLIFELNDKQLQQQVTEWILTNILAPDKIDLNRDVSIRYYCISILKKSINDGLIDEKIAKNFLPPYKQHHYVINLNKDALSGTRMNGYKGITYDLSRYVLIDRITSIFDNYKCRQSNQFKKLIGKIAKKQPDYAGISEEQFILSASYAYVINCGWNEEEFDFYKSGDKVTRGIDGLIRGVYYPASHGSQSTVMTLCEKYIWQARNEIMGFLADRLSVEDNVHKWIDNYEILENYIIPMRKLNGTNIFSDNYWYIPEVDKLKTNKTICSKDDILNVIKQISNLEWSKWIFANNVNRKFKIDKDNLMSLNSYTHISSANYMDTVIAIKSILVPQENLHIFLERILNNTISLSSHSDFESNPETYCYISPKEICWFPWIKQYNDFIFEDNNDLGLIPTTMNCCANIGEECETSFYLPSKKIREILGIVRSDNYLFFDKLKNVIAEYYFVGDKYKTYQEYLFVDKEEVLKKLKELGYEIVWLLKEYRQEDMLSKEKFGRFYAEKEIVSIGYLDGNEFKIVLQKRLK